MQDFPTVGQNVTGANVPDGFESFILSKLLCVTKKTVIHVSPHERHLEQTLQELKFLAPQIEVLSFPGWDCLPYDRVSPRGDIISTRIETLARLLEPTSAHRCVLTTASALLQRVPPQASLHGKALSYRVGDKINLENLKCFLTDNGYLRVQTVREAGEFAIRGGIIDLFPGSLTTPVRIDLFGDEIESLKFFDPLTQRSIVATTHFTLHTAGEVILSPEAISRFRSRYQKQFGPAQPGDFLYDGITQGLRPAGVEHWMPLFYEQCETLFDYIKQDAPATFVFSHQVKQRLEARCAQIEEHYEARRPLTLKAQGIKGQIYNPLPPDFLYLTLDELQKQVAQHAALTLSPFNLVEGQSTLDFNAQTIPTPSGGSLEERLSTCETYLKKAQEEGKQIIIDACGKAAQDRIQTLLKKRGWTSFKTGTTAADFKDSSISPASLYLTTVGFTSSFSWNEGLLLTEEALLGEKSRPKPKTKAKDAHLFINEASALAPEDYVVHDQHGIGQFIALETLTVSGHPHDCVALSYHGGDKLFVPVENLDVLSRFGSEGGPPLLDKLGAAAWQARRAKVKERIKEMAGELIALAAQRHLKSAENYEAAEGLYQEFCSRFPFNETEDQERVINETLADLQKGSPMDRLVCGDVGFGKTEVALRSAFVVASCGKQVVLVVPTTLLCRQHYENFQKRFEGFGLRVEQLSRLVPASKLTKIKKDIAAGQVDVVIATHAIFSKSLAFKNLGLLIVDEEQRFGVAQKEKLKHLRQDVHVLTLTATPIPRTLQMALTGVRDLSLITTPPVDRLAVRTFILPFDPVIIREAILREFYRGGQTYYVCPRIQDLENLAEKLRTLVPEVKIVTAHGRLPPRDLEKVMTAFYEGEYDLLLSTNIIESGIDIEKANTMFIHRADRFGLAQLYQLRGRVGRSKQRAYTYLTVPENTPLSKTSQRRLEVMQTLDTLGAGFQLASHDMDIRGAGNLLGEEQSGHIREVGVELYQQMLQEAVEKARQGNGFTETTEPKDTPKIENFSPQINLGLAVLLPEDYVPDLSVRLDLYRRLNALKSETALTDFREELLDRFGPLPQPVENLLSVIALKDLCRKTWVEKIDTGEKGAVLTFVNNTFPHPDRLISFITDQRGTAKVRPDQKLVFTRLWKDEKMRLQGVREILEQLIALV